VEEGEQNLYFKYYERKQTAVNLVAPAGLFQKALSIAYILFSLAWPVEVTSRGEMQTQ
jgi:hypothetical protein